MAGRLDLRCDQGATFSLQFVIKSNGSPVNLTLGYTARMKVKKFLDTEEVLTLTTENGGITLASNGTVTVTASATATDAITPGSYQYDFELVNGATVDRYLQGKFDVVGSVTK